MNSIRKAIRIRLCKFSGEDYTFIQKCNKKIQYYFSLIGLLVLLILICSFASALYFTEHLFHNWVLDICIGIIWGYIITNMYVLLLYTISPTLLPTKNRKNKAIKNNNYQLSFSMGLRVSIVILLAIIIAQPLNVLILKPTSTALAFEIKYLLGSNPLATFITLLIIGIFLLPVYLKYGIRKLSEFYEKEIEIKKRIIGEDYRDFKREYEQLLKRNIEIYNKKVRENLLPFLNELKKVNYISYEQHLFEIEYELTNEKIEKYEYWADPPYRTIPKSKTINALSEKDLLNHIYPKQD